MSEFDISIFTISQATTTLLQDLYIQKTSLVFIQKGHKTLYLTKGETLCGKAGDIIIFPPDSIATMENRTWYNTDYQAIGLTFSHDIIKHVFPDPLPPSAPQKAEILSPRPEETVHILAAIQQTVANDQLPDIVRKHRLMEPILWLKALGITLSVPRDQSALGQVRALIETDLTYAWRAADVAKHFAMSEATLRRWLLKSDMNFSKILKNARLEKALALLQTTNIPISEIALSCGFKTPSHFSDSFKNRFKVQPTAIRSPENDRIPIEIDGMPEA